MQFKLSGSFVSTVLVSLFCSSIAFAQTGQLSGTVTDSESLDTLPGATVILLNSDNLQIGGAASDATGQFIFQRLAPGTYTLQVSFIGFETHSASLSLDDGQNLIYNPELIPSGLNLGTVEIASARRRERLMDTPASVSVMFSESIGLRTGSTTGDALRTISGVNVVSTGIEGTEISLRGFNRTFSTDVLILSNDRQTNLASWSMTVPNIAPGRLDIERVEVIRGPGASLYGGGSDVGVIHYVTKDPFDHPGTAFSLALGEREYKGFEFRHAGVAGKEKRLGYKLNAQVVDANDWEYDSADLEDEKVLDRMIDLSDNRSDVSRIQIDGEIGYRWADDSEVTVNAGRTYASGNRFAAVGRFYMDNIALDYGQARFKKGGLFAQFYAYRTVNAGDNLFYDIDFDDDDLADPFVDESFMYSAQVQYALQLNQANDLVFGADSDWQTPRSQETLFGAFEGEDGVREVGIYAQSRHALTKQLNLSLGIRADHHNVLDDIFLTPRAGLVYAPTPGHRIRASVIRGYSPPTPSQLFQDIPAASFGPSTIVLRARPTDIEWERNPAFESISGSDLVVTSLVPGTVGSRIPAGLPLDLVYGLVYGGMSAIPASTLAGAMSQAGINASVADAEQIMALLSPSSTSVVGFSNAEFRAFDLVAREFTEPYTPGSVPKRVPRYNTSIELGYKGLIGTKFIFEIEVHRSRFENFSGGAANNAPVAFVPSLENDLVTSLAAGIDGNEDLRSLLSSLGETGESYSNFLVDLIGGSPVGPSTPIGIVQPVQPGVPGEGEVPNLYMYADQSGSIVIWGIDTSFEAEPFDKWTAFGNFSWVNDNVFGPEEAGVDVESFMLGTNTPKVMASLGLEYDTGAWSAFLSGRYRGEFDQLTTYSGHLDAFTVFDASVEYNLSAASQGATIGVHIRNVFDDVHREFLGGPKIGRISQLRLTYTL